MGTLILLAAEASHGSEGIGFNFNILETNIINLSVVIGVLFVVGSKALKSTLSERQEGISTEIKEVEARLAKAESELKEQKQNVADAKTEAERILSDAKARAKSSKESILAQAKQDVERMKASAAQDLNAEQDRVIAELRQRVVSLALEKVETQLPSRLDDASQKQLIDRSIAVLGG